ncbi:nSTAND1 domain-containing NTPase [Nonomuraea endophytica]|uniref:nSTAND1 domain-containing NTPase n=1 Tax=Nonomuraea endophytica TaxID=714136 RepID=UPI0037C6547D
MATALVRVLDRRGEYMGFGLLAAPGKVLTCAHVVARALEEPNGLEDGRGRIIHLDFPFVAEGLTVTSRVAVWTAMGEDGTGDVAGLELIEDVPEGARAVGMTRGGSLHDHDILAYGYQLADAPTWVPGRIVGEVRSGWLQLGINVLTGGLRIKEGFSGTPVWDVSSGQVVGLITRAYLRPEMWLAYAISGENFYEAWPELRAFFDYACPFRGLTPFSTADQDLFFGRDALTGRAAEMITGHDQTVVTGASGVGKSSVVAAAVIPELEQQGHAVLAVRPMARDGLWPSIAAALAVRIESQDADARDIPDGNGKGSEADLTEALRIESTRSRVHRLCDLLGTDRVVLVLDQCEDLFQEDPEQARELLMALSELSMVRHPHGRPYVRAALVIREDLLPEILASDPFRDVPPAVLLVGPLDSAQLRAAVEGPLEAAGYARYEEGLVDRIVDDLRLQPYALSTLQVVLTELWDRKTSGGLLRMVDYVELSSGQGPLTTHLQRIWHELASDRREPALRLLLALVVPLEGGAFVRRVALVDDLDPQERKAAEALAAARLVVLRGQGHGQSTVELVHDALIEHWPVLADHLALHRDFLVRRDELRRQRTLWRRTGRHNGQLLRGVVLKETVAWLRACEDLVSADERTFIDLSQARQRRTRRGWLLGTAAVTVIVALLVGVAVAQTLSARGTAAEQQADRIAKTAISMLDQRPDVAKQLAVTAYQTSPTSAATEALTRSVSAPGAIDVPASVVATAYTADGQVLLLGTAEAVYTWDVRTRRFVGALRGWGGSLAALAAAPQGRVVATASTDRTVQLWDLTDPAAPRADGRVPTAEWAASRLAFAKDGLLATVLEPVRNQAEDDEAVVRIWNVRQRQPRLAGAFIPHVGAGPTASFGRDGTVLAIGGTTTLLVDVAKPTAPRMVTRLAAARGVLSPDGQVVVERGEKLLRVWDLSSIPPTQFTLHDDRFSGTRGTSISPDGRFAITGDSAAVVDLKGHPDPVLQASCENVGGGPAEILPESVISATGLAATASGSTVRLTSLTKPVCGQLDSPDILRNVVRLSVDGRYLAVASDLAGLTVADVGSSVTPTILEKQPPLAMGGNDFVAAIALSGDGKILVSSGADNVASVWKWDGPHATKSAEINGSASRIDALALGQDGAILAVAGSGQVRLWDLKATPKPRSLALVEPGTAKAIALDSSRGVLAVGAGNDLQIWDVVQPASPRQIAVLSAHAGGVKALRFDPATHRLFSTGEDHVIRVWNVSGSRKVTPFATLTGHDSPVSAVAVRDGLVASGDDNGVVRIWRMTDDGDVMTVGVLRAQGGASIASVDLSRAGQRVVASNTGRQVLVWNIEPKAMVQTICATVAMTISRADWRARAEGLTYKPPCGAAAAELLPSGSLAPTPAVTAQCDPPGLRKAAGEGIPASSTVRISVCRGGHAYANFQGPRLGVHGNQDVLFRWVGGTWKPISWGATSHGRFIAESLDAEGLDGRKLALLFPEAQIFVPSLKLKPIPSVPTLDF